MTTNSTWIITTYSTCIFDCANKLLLTFFNAFEDERRNNISDLGDDIRGQGEASYILGRAYQDFGDAETAMLVSYSWFYFCYIALYCYPQVRSDYWHWSLYYEFSCGLKINFMFSRIRNRKTISGNCSLVIKAIKAHLFLTE